MNRLRRLSAAVALLLCFAAPVASAAHAERPAGPASPSAVAGSGPDWPPAISDVPLCC